MESLSVDTTVAAALTAMRSQLFEKGAGGTGSLNRAFQLADLDGSGALDVEEFEEALQFAGLFVSKPQLSALFRYFNADKDGVVSYTEFLSALRGSVSARVTAFLDKIFNSFDSDGSGVVTAVDLRGRFNVSSHPDVLQGRVTEEQALKRFLSTFETGESKDGSVTRDEFHSYYADVAASAPNEDYFCEMLESCWMITEGDVSPADAKKIARYEQLLQEKVRQKCKSSESPKNKLRSVFQFFDSDSTGTVTIDELAGALAQLGLSIPRKDVSLFMSQYDKDGSGYMSYPEFVAHMYGDE